MATTKKLGWHFLPSNMTLGYGDGRVAKVGETLSIKPHQSPVTCGTGMHASETPSQAANHTKGPVITRVEVSGDIDFDSDKFCGRHRKVLWAYELSKEDVKRLAKASGYTLTMGSLTRDSVADLLNEVARYRSTAFDSWIEKLAAGQIKGSPAPAPKPRFTPKVLLANLMPRVVRTKKEILRDVGKFYDMTTTDDWSDDAFQEAVETLDGDKILIISDFTPAGEDGYVLKPRSR